jgi:hypothetical protein
MLSDAELTQLRSFWMWDPRKEKWDFIRDWEENKIETMRKFESTCSGGGTEKCRRHRSEKRQLRTLRLSREEERVPPMIAGGAGRRKPDWPLHSEMASRMLKVGRAFKKEILI